MRRNYTIGLFLCMLVISCKTYKEVHYDVLRPAAYSVPPEIKSLVVVNNSFPFNADNAHIAMVVGDEVRLDTVQVDSFAAIVISSLRKELAYRQFFDTVYADTVRYNQVDVGRAFKVLRPSEVSSICSKFDADAVLSLEGARYGTNINVLDMGEEYFSTMDANGLLFWRLYDRYEKVPLYKTSQVDTIFWSGVGANVNNSVGSFPSLKDATIELGGYLGATFADQLVPFWEPVTRRIYVSGNPLFVNASEWLAKDNRYEAEKIWAYIYEKGSAKEKWRSANNIAVSMEARGELKKAMEWAYQSYQACENAGGIEAVDAAKDLYVDLVRRYRDEKKLSKQVGGAL